MPLYETLEYRKINKLFNESIKNNLELSIWENTTRKDVCFIAKSKLAKANNVPEEIIKKAKESNNWGIVPKPKPKEMGFF